jgi:hypothetical protein
LAFLSKIKTDESAAIGKLQEYWSYFLDNSIHAPILIFISILLLTSTIFVLFLSCLYTKKNDSDNDTTLTDDGTSTTKREIKATSSIQSFSPQFNRARSNHQISMNQNFKRSSLHPSQQNYYIQEAFNTRRYSSIPIYALNQPPAPSQPPPLYDHYHQFINQHNNLNHIPMIPRPPFIVQNNFRRSVQNRASIQKSKSNYNMGQTQANNSRNLNQIRKTDQFYSSVDFNQ